MNSLQTFCLAYQPTKRKELLWWESIKNPFLYRRSTPLLHALTHLSFFLYINSNSTHSFLFMPRNTTPNILQFPEQRLQGSEWRKTRCVTHTMCRLGGSFWMFNAIGSSCIRRRRRLRVAVASRWKSGACARRQGTLGRFVAGCTEVSTFGLGGRGPAASEWVIGVWIAGM